MDEKVSSDVMLLDVAKKILENLQEMYSNGTNISFVVDLYEIFSLK